MSTVQDDIEYKNYYKLRDDSYEVILEGRFWNCQGKHIAIVATITKGIDWAAYIGTDAPDSYTERETLDFVARKGNKLSEKDARHFFPEIILKYRY